MPIQVTSHPPERALRAMPLLCAGCGCCCSCCCIHTAGGIVGALVGNAAPPQEIAEVEADPLKPAIQVNAAYWRTVGVLSLITLIGGLGIFGIVIILLCLPLIQLLAAVITACRLGNEPGWKWWQLARITGFSLLGSLIGTIITVVLITQSK